MSTACLEREEEMETEQPNDPRVNTSLLNERVILLAPTCGWWAGNYQLDSDYEIHVGETTIDKDKYTRPRTKLLESCQDTKDWKLRFMKIDNIKNSLIEQYSLPFPIRGVRIVPRNVADEFLGRLIGPCDDQGRPLPSPGIPRDAKVGHSIAYLMRQAADEFVVGYDRIMQLIQANTAAAVWAKVARKIPTKEEMREKFYLDVTPVYISSEGAETTTLSDLQQHRQQISDSVRRKTEEAIMTMISEPRAQLAEALQNLSELIQRDGNVSEKSFRPVRAAMEKIRRFEFVADEEMLAQIRSLEGRMNGVTPSQLDSVTAQSNGLLAAINQVQEDVSDAQKQEQIFKRHGVLRSIVFE